jgi:hypothetical protein
VALAGALLRGGAAATPAWDGARLLAVEGADAGRVWTLGGTDVLGRGARATVQLADPGASRAHARLTLEGAALRVEDLGSKNGIFARGAPVRRGPAVLRDGEELRVGASRLVFLARADAAPGGGPLEAQGPSGEPEQGAAGAAGRRGHRARLRIAAALLVSAAALAVASL